MANDTKVFSLEGKGIKFNTAEDVEPHIKALREMEDVEEVRLQGNTVGIEAAAAFADVLRTKKTLQVSPTPTLPLPPYHLTDTTPPGRQPRRHLHRPPPL